MQGGEYFKLYKLVGHYTSHQTSVNTYDNFISFLDDHYLNKDHHEKEHKELPFKNQSGQSIVIAYHYHAIERIEVALPVESKIELKFNYSDPIPNQEFGSVWNPPRMS